MRQTHSSIGYALSLGIVFVLSVAARPNQAQTTGTTSSNRADAVDLQPEAESALDRIQQNDVGQGIVDATHYIEWAAHVEPGRSIPVLEAYFARSHDPELRNEIATVLVSLGDKDLQFWNLILDQAQGALSEDPPDPFEIGQSGESSAPCSSEALLKWAKGRNLSPEEACKEASLGIPQRIRPLSETGDLRAIPVLKEALKCRNPLIQLLAAHGLVLTGDRDSITLVIETIEHAPQERAQTLADSLIESVDPRAQPVLHQYLPDVNYPEAHQFRTQSAQWRRPILTER
jgi:HEAT repeat protein